MSAGWRRPCVIFSGWCKEALIVLMCRPLYSLSEKAPASTLSQDRYGDQVELAPRQNLPPLLSKLSERKPEALDYLGVSYGVTGQLFKFWKKSGFTPVYMRQTAVGFFFSLCSGGVGPHRHPLYPHHQELSGFVDQQSVRFGS